MSMVRMIVGGVDTHADQHVAAAIDANGGIVRVESFPADHAGFETSFGWLVCRGEVVRVGVEGTGPYAHDHRVRHEAPPGTIRRDRVADQLRCGAV